MMILYFILVSFVFWLLYVNFMTMCARKDKHPVYTALYYFLEARLRRHVKYSEGWRHELAVAVCRVLVEPWDPDHCALSRLRR